MKYYNNDFTISIALLTGQVNGRVIKYDTMHVTITARGRFDLNRGNSSIIDVIGTSVNAN